MQDATTEAVQAIEGIGRTIGAINEITSAISLAVEQQGTATQEIARNVQEAALGTGQVSEQHRSRQSRRRKDRFGLKRRARRRPSS